MDKNMVLSHFPQCTNRQKATNESSFKFRISCPDKNRDETFLIPSFKFRVEYRIGDESGWNGAKFMKSFFGKSGGLGFSLIIDNEWIVA
jgi:hypothetical protein